MPAMIATSIYLKPLIPTALAGMSFDRVLRRLQRDLLKRLKAKLQQTVFSDRAKKALARSMRIEVHPSSLRVTTNHPAFFPLVDGQAKGQMTWLTKAKRPIPIITDTGKLIFRNATAKSMANGSWIHPGRKPSDFVSKAKSEARKFLKGKLVAEVRKQIRAGLQSAARAR